MFLLAGLVVFLTVAVAYVFSRDGVPFVPVASVTAPQPQDDSRPVVPIGEPAPTPVVIGKADTEPAIRPEVVPLPRRVEQRVPFIPQAPGGNWSDPLFPDACEEASALMAALFATGEKAPADVGAALHEAGDYAERTFGQYVDTSAADTLTMLREHFGVTGARLLEAPTAEEMKREIAAKRVIVAPTNGRMLGNPNFRAPGPEHHMLVIIGYDDERDLFITNDPGTRLGAAYTYKTAVLMAAIGDYPTGRHETAKERPSRVIVVGRDAV
jgi:hypothetical protein